MITATAETRGCAIGDVGTYRWSVEGKGTVMTLTTTGADACMAREEALAGPWVRSDLPLPGGGGQLLPRGTYLTATFNPFDDAGAPGQLEYMVPDGWGVEEEGAASLTFHRLASLSASQPSTDSFISLIARPRMAAVFAKGAPCGQFSDAPGVGLGVEDIVAAIRTRAGVVSTAPAAVAIGGYEGQLLDLHAAPSWTGGCLTPDGPVVGIPILYGVGPGTGPAVAIGPDHPVRLILVDLTSGRTVCIATFSPEPASASAFQQLLGTVMPIIESFQFHAPP